MPDSPLGGDVVEEEEERGGGEDGQHGRVAVHHSDSQSSRFRRRRFIFRDLSLLLLFSKFIVHRKGKQDTIFQVEVVCHEKCVRALFAP